MINQTLVLLSNKEIGKKEAYRMLYPRPAKVRGPKKAHFLKLRIRIPEEKGVSVFLAFLFWLPMPLFFAKMVLRKVKFDDDKIPLDKNELMKLVAVRGLKVDVKTQDGVRVFIKTI